MINQNLKKKTEYLENKNGKFKEAILKLKMKKTGHFLISYDIHSVYLLIAVLLKCKVFPF